jgi:hypothetical protein
VNGEPGHPAIDAGMGAILHLCETDVTGGEGGSGGGSPFGCPGGQNAAGGPGIRMAAGAMILITGTGSQTVAGGPGGDRATCFTLPPGPEGAAAEIEAGAVLLHSNVAFRGLPVVGVDTPVSPPDPCLTATGSGLVGTQLTFTVHGQPGDEARLRVGRQMVVQDVPSVFEDRLTVALRSYALGVLPASGTATFTMNVPGILPPGAILIAQASTTSPQETRLTQSVPIVVR